TGRGVHEKSPLQDYRGVARGWAPSHQRRCLTIPSCCPVNCSVTATVIRVVPRTDSSPQLPWARSRDTDVGAVMQGGGTKTNLSTFASQFMGLNEWMETVTTCETVVPPVQQKGMFRGIPSGSVVRCGTKQTAP